jgi:hypothetical protein
MPAKQAKAVPIKATPLRKYDLSSSEELLDVLQASICKILQEKFGFSRSWTLFVLIGLSKIAMAIALMWMYMWRAPWSVKFPWCVLCVVISIITYIVDCGLPVLWWPNYFGTFKRTKGSSSLTIIICAHSPFYKGTAKLELHVLPFMPIRKRLPKQPTSELEVSFGDFFTTGGYFVEDEFWKVFEKLVRNALKDAQKAGST